MLVGLIETKCDLKEERQVRTSEGVKLARQLGCSFYQTSSITRYNVDKTFESIGRTYRDATDAREENVERSLPVQAENVVQADDKSQRRRRFSLTRWKRAK